MWQYNQTVSSDELYHYGVPGMKWGKRKHAISVKAAGHKVASKIYSLNEKTYKKINPTLSSMNAHAKNEQIKKAQKAQEAADTKRNAKKDAKSQKVASTKSSVKKYNSSYDAASRLSDKADKKWSEVNKMYKDLGKTKVTRMINAARGKSDAAKKYSKEYDKASKMSDKADAKWRETKKLRKKTGRNGISRTINNIRYGS